MVHNNGKTFVHKVECVLQQICRRLRLPLPQEERQRIEGLFFLEGQVS